MSEPIADLVPDPAVAARPSPHDRNRGGAPKGNRNALKHGRSFRLRDMLPPEHPVATGAAHRLVSRERRIAERHAANLLALARLGEDAHGPPHHPRHAFIDD